MGGDTTLRCRVLTLDDVEAVPGLASLAWRPLRAELGLRAFGVSSFIAENAGDDVMEPHRESGGRGHQELHIVMRGAARFTLDGVTFDAPAGTLVSVPDADVHRHGVEVGPGTEVPASGGDPVFRSAGHEWMWRVCTLLPHQLGRARALADDGLARLPDGPGLVYVQALAAAAERQPERVREWLAKAIEREPLLREEARTDELLVGLVENPAS